MTTATLDPSVSPAPATPAEQVNASEKIEPRPFRWHLLILLGITILGFVLRFSFPTRPPLWGDDAYTVYRTHADYQSMLDILQYDGFTPLHYELYWLIGRLAGHEQTPMTQSGKPIVHSTGLTPAVVRALPALWGSLMPPVMYFLAVQLVRRRIALVAALVSACSAYLLGYSRDGKMYIMLWMFSALSTACLLWWFRTGLRIAWLAWVAASLAMASSHMPGVAMLPFQAIFFLTRSRVHWKDSIGFVIGLAIAAAGPAAYITQFNTWAQQEVEDFGFEVEGLGWVVEYNAGRDGPDLLRYATSAYLLSWEWPKAGAESRIQPWILTTLKGATWLLLFLGVVGVMPWSRRLRGLPALATDEPAPQPWWRAFLWLGLWLVIPVYFMYCRSVTDFESPAEWAQTLGLSITGGNPKGPIVSLISGLLLLIWIKLGVNVLAFGVWLVLLIPIAAVATGIFLSRRLRLGLIWLLAAVLAAALLVCLFRTGVSFGGTDWVQSLFRPFILWSEWLTHPHVLLAAAVIVPGLSLYYCGTSWRDRLKRVLQFAAVVGAILLACHLAYKAADAKLNKEIEQFVAKNPAYQSSDPVHSQRLLEQVKEQLSTRGAPWQSIFMPRYVGFVWIPFCIALCALYMRLPTRPLRILAVALLVGVNLLQFRARLFAGTEPPLDIVAQDVWRHDTINNRAADATGRTYVNDAAVDSPGHPGYGTLQGQQGKYYLGLARGYWIHPTEWKRVRSDQYFDIHPKGSRGGVSPSLIAADARRYPNLKRIIVWDKHFGRTPDADSADRLIDYMGPGWKRVSQQDYNVRLHWNWTDLYVYRRTEYERAQ
jgi:4-amino-4-deoxy-L-arabinose transferase-like glycosyltransferase